MDSKFTLSAFLLFISFTCFAQSSSNNASSPLPLVWDNIQVKKNAAGNNQITWWTLLEYNVTEFIIQRSDNGINFRAFKRVEANGNNINYQVEDQSTGNLFYRIINIDSKGNYSYSKIVNIEGKAAASFLNYDGRNTLKVQTNTDHLISINLVDMNGRIFAFSKNNIHNGNLDISYIPRGIYIVSAPGSNLTANRFIKL